MGFDTSLFVSAVDNELICSICTMVLEDPMQSPCDHVFCSECINKWLCVKESCPVDDSLLSYRDLKPSPRYFCNLLKNLSMRCQYGCHTIISMEHLESHAVVCTHNPDSKVDCDHGCNLTITRREYNELNCLEHLANRNKYQEEEYNHRTEKTLFEHHHEVAKIRSENNRLSEKLAKRQRVISRQENAAEYFNKMRRSTNVWNNCKKVKISSHPPIILEPEDNTTNYSCAQLCNYLSLENRSFKMKIIDLGSRNAIGIGLAQKFQSIEFPTGFVTYFSSGKVKIGTEKAYTTAWRRGDIVEIGLNLARFNVESDGSAQVEVNISLNEISVTKTMTKIPLGGFYPTVFMREIDNMNPKVLYLK